MSLPFRKNVLDMKPYSPGKPISEVLREFGLSRAVKLASNENPWGPSPKAVEAMYQGLSSVHLYPDGGAFELRQAISHKFEIDPGQVILGNGSDEILRMLGWILIGSPEDQVVMADPSFVVYAATAEIAPCELIKVPLNRKFQHDLHEMARRITSRTRLIFIANPNNPTGTYVSANDLDGFLQDVPDSVMVVLDEAYFEFAREHADYPDGREYVLSGRPNVTALRTFSKAYGLAGLRLGYGFASAEVVDAIERCRQPFHVNKLAQEAGIAALGDEDHLARTVSATKAAIADLNRIFSNVGARVVPTAANFIWADLGRPCRPVFQALLEKGVITRTGDIFGAPTFLRVSVGTPEEQAILEEALNGVYAGAAH